MIPINDNTRLIDLTVGELKTILGKLVADAISEHEGVDNSQEYVYGLRGICELFGCSKNTAIRLKEEVIKKAVYQDGRRILTDPVMAKKLFNGYYSKKK